MIKALCLTLCLGVALPYNGWRVENTSGDTYMAQPFFGWVIKVKPGFVSVLGNVGWRYATLAEVDDYLKEVE